MIFQKKNNLVLTKNTAVEELDRLFYQAVNRQLISDVEIVLT